MTSTKKARILLADDHSLVAAGISKLLDAEFELIGTVGDGRALVAAAKSDPPDVILLDISMPILNGLEAAAQISKKYPRAKVIILSMHTQPGIRDSRITLRRRRVSAQGRGAS